MTLYSSLILPYLNYGILAWGNTHQTLLDKLLLLQKKALRIICRLAPLSHSDPLFHKYNVLKVHDLYLFHLGQFMFDYNNNALPRVFDSMFSKNESFHNYPTRQSNEFHLPLFRTSLAQNTFIYTGPRFWNSLNCEIKNSRSLNCFKRRLKHFMFDSYQGTNSNN